MRKFKTHFFDEVKDNASVCGVRPSAENWCRHGYCTPVKRSVTCGNCKRVMHGRKTRKAPK